VLFLTICAITSSTNDVDRYVIIRSLQEPIFDLEQEPRNSMVFSLQADYTGQVAAACKRS
jgi:hypothetical protein